MRRYYIEFQCMFKIHLTLNGQSTTLILFAIARSQVKQSEIQGFSETKYKVISNSSETMSMILDSWVSCS